MGNKTFLKSLILSMVFLLAANLAALAQDYGIDQFILTGTVWDEVDEVWVDTGNTWYTPRLHVNVLLTSFLPEGAGSCSNRRSRPTSTTRNSNGRFFRRLTSP